jgi:HrpA-like RNA helicase
MKDLSKLVNINERTKLETLKLNLKRMILAEKHLESKLPILSKKKDIFEELKKKNLIIIEGETGSGKSTQLPQLLC